MNDVTIPGRGPLAAGEISKIFKLILNFQSKNINHQLIMMILILNLVH